MKVVAWTAYGDTEVYAADTPEQLTKVIQLMIGSLDGWEEEVMIEKVQKHLAKYPTDMAEIEKAFRTIIKVAGDDQESFESVILTEVKYA